jgi:hypothetical protein
MVLLLVMIEGSRLVALLAPKPVCSADEEVVRAGLCVPCDQQFGTAPCLLHRAFPPPNGETRRRGPTSELASRYARITRRISSGSRRELATVKSKAPAGLRRIHEIKFDCYRVQIHPNKRERVGTPTGHDWTKRFSLIAGAFDLPDLTPARRLDNA